MRRREFVAAGATVALFTAMPSWAATLKQFKLGVITDEVTQDFEKALSWAKGYGLNWVELRFGWNKYVTDFAEDDVKRARELLAKYDMKVSVVDSPYFKTPLPGTQSRFSEAKADPMQSDFSQQAAILERAFARAKDFGTDKVRIFSFLRVPDPNMVFDRVAKELEKTAETAKRDSSSLAGGKQLLQQVQQAVGGAEKLAAVKDYTEVADFQIEPAAGGFRTKQTDLWISPSYFRQENELPTGKMVAYSDGKTGWIATPQGQAPLGGAQLKQVQSALFRSYFRLLLSDQIPGRTVNLLEPDTLEISDGGEVARLVVDPQTGLPDRIMYDSVAVSGPPVSVVNQYGDFREVQGVKVPHKITITQGGHKFADVTVSDYKFNAGLRAEDLNKRP